MGHFNHCSLCPLGGICEGQAVVEKDAGWSWFCTEEVVSTFKLKATEIIEYQTTRTMVLKQSVRTHTCDMITLEVSHSFVLLLNNQVPQPQVIYLCYVNQNTSEVLAFSLGNCS